MTNAKEIAKHLLDIKAVSLSPTAPFTWASGLKSPIYCDNRVTMSYPVVRRQIAQGLAQLIQDTYGEIDVVAGTATAGIPHAAWVAEILDLPMIYIRSSAKKHGKGNQIEGVLHEGQRVVVIEDLISTGGSVLEATDAVENAGGKVLGVAAIFTYELAQATKQFSAKNMAFTTLTQYSTLIEVARENGVISENELKLLMQWRENPQEWNAL
ncbi:orotate phosphoribosyltransferase [Vagococcus lutrae]|uniref:orotate phosphoribosyltransferase n=1 Tax=Vagococcus lutrae TaxID=81947 RepID=UPI0014446E10|nr:orotate phosphoribosyltransferase [Vagococcus lutrae]MCO7150558.1 orotate phosphoribosyltransferase [Vagococcus lutrae]MDT2808535.1 orotate phosphoribosyltransferase [Vagococcus lutrae]MDT2818587.1 orotate phosphoribosyltransferase [Vagococcus lutrae]MDT2843349.1 orotate phosphoribosyltransferase [Vagococcus lutrae]MDY3705418.1 orotate phosphoribosyltransferase [Vagococcus lutrae]